MIENLHIEETKYTPKIDMDGNARVVSIVGKSYPENTFEFYEPVMKWLEDYFELNTKGETKINLEITYFNSSSSKLFFDFFDLIEEASEQNDIVINWIYDSKNEYALDAGENFQEDFETLTINLITK